MTLKEYLALIGYPPANVAALEREFARYAEYDPRLSLERQPAKVRYGLVMHNLGSGYLWDLVREEVSVASDFSLGYTDQDCLRFFLTAVVDYRERFTPAQVLEIISKSVICLLKDLWDNDPRDRRTAGEFLATVYCDDEVASSLLADKLISGHGAFGDFIFLARELMRACWVEGGEGDPETDRRDSETGES